MVKLVCHAGISCISQLRITPGRRLILQAAHEFTQVFLLTFHLQDNPVDELIIHPFRLYSTARR